MTDGAKGGGIDMVDIFMKSHRNKKGEASPETAVVLVSMKFMVYTSVMTR